MNNIVNAFLLSAVAVVCVIMLDFFADRSSEVASELKAATPSTPVGLVHDPTVENLNDPQTILQKTWGQLQKQSTDANSLERALRTIIDSFGLLVGLCWEKATDAAIETIIEGDDTLSHHIVISKILAAVIVVVIMYPAWRYH